MQRRWSTLLVSVVLLVSACGTGEPPASPTPSAGGSAGPVPAASEAAGAATAAPGGAASAVAGAPTPPPINRDPATLVVAVDAFNGDFDPASAYVQSEAVIWRGIYEGLVRLKGDSASDVEPLLADSWETNADKSSWTFHLHPGVTFSDGTPFDAQAVKDNYARTIGLELGTNLIIGSFVTDPAKQIVVVDPLTVRFDLGTPVPQFDVVLAAQYGTGIVSPKVFKEHSTGPKDQGHEWLQTNAVGTGPYVLQTLAPGDQVVLARNPTYWRGWDGSHFTKVIIRSIPESSTRRQLLESGEIDTSIEGLADDVAAIRSDPRFVVGDFKNLDIAYVMLGEYGPLAKPEARQAMNYLFPYDEFLQSVMKGTMERANGVFPDLLRTHDPSVFRYTTDLEKAKQLFSAAGVAPGTVFTYEYYTGFGKEAGLVLQQQLQKVGMDLKLIEKEYSAYNADLTTDRPVDQRADMYYWAWWPDYNDPSDFSWILFNSAAAPDQGPYYNSGYYKNARVDEIINDGFTQTDDAKLTAEFKEAQDILVQQDPAWIPVGQRLDETLLRNDIKGMVFNPLYIETWDFYALSRG